MGHLSNQHIKVFLTTIVKYSLLIILINCNMKNSDFKVIGNEEIIKDIKINVQKGYKNDTIENLISNNKINNIESSEDGIYIFYISYKGLVINKVVDDVFYGVSDPAHIFNVEEKDKQIIITYIGRESDVESKKGYKVILLPKEQYFKINNISDSEEIKKTEILFK